LIIKFPANIVFSLIWVGFLVVPFLSLSEIFELSNIDFAHTGEDVNSYLSQIQTPLYIKGLKDFIMFFLFIFTLRHYKIRFNRTSFFLLLLFGAFLGSFINSIIMPHDVKTIDYVIKVENFSLLALFSGLRWGFPFFIPFFIFPFIDTNFISKISRLVFLIFIIHFLFQLHQLFSEFYFFGETSLHLSARNPGLFVIPSVASSFSLMLYFYYKYIYDNQIFSDNIIDILFLLSILLTQSIVGFFGFLIIWISIHRKSFKSSTAFVATFFCAIPLFIYLNSRGLSGLIISSSYRLKFIYEAWERSSFFSSFFGLGTNTYSLLNGYGIATDSTFASIISNLGIFGALISFWIIIYILFLSFLIKNLALLIFTLILLLIMLTINITESYPVNLLAIIVISYFMGSVKADAKE